MAKSIGRWIVMWCLLLVMDCRNPFFPQVGIPPESHNEQRSDPQGLLGQLVESYETKNIDLFIDLLPQDGSFQFFVAPDYFNDYVTRHKNLKEPPDDRLQFIGQSGYYYYWTQDIEIEGHRRLFSRASTIEFKDKPVVQSVRRFVDGSDSLAELLVSGGSFEISYYSSALTIEVIPVSIGQQVFLIEKDPENLWVIRKWYDFSEGE